MTDACDQTTCLLLEYPISVVSGGFGKWPFSAFWAFNSFCRDSLSFEFFNPKWSTMIVQRDLLEKLLLSSGWLEGLYTVLLSQEN